MFGRKRKKDDETVGLAGLGTGGVSPSGLGTGGLGTSGVPPSGGGTSGVSPSGGGTSGVSPSGLGTGGVSPSLSPTPSVTVRAQPAAPPPAPAAEPGGSPSTEASPFDAVAALTPGMMSANPAAMLGQILSGHGPVGELVAQIRADPEGFRQRMLAQAQAAGIPTVVMSPQPGGPGPTMTPAGMPQPQHVDVIDELTKAADLHHQGVLTDAEFDAYKKKLLGE